MRHKASRVVSPRAVVAFSDQLSKPNSRSRDHCSAARTRRRNPQAASLATSLRLRHPQPEACSAHRRRNHRSLKVEVCLAAH